MVDDNAMGTAHPQDHVCSRESLGGRRAHVLLDNQKWRLHGDLDKARNIMQNAPIGYSASSLVIDVLLGLRAVYLVFQQ